MNTIDFISIVFLAIFTLICITIAMTFGVWWYYGAGVMTALLAEAVYDEGKNQ